MQLEARRARVLAPVLSGLVLGVIFFDAVVAVAILSIIVRGQIATDWISFYSAGTMVRTGSAAHLYDASAQAITQRGLFGPDVHPMGYPLPVFVAFLFAPLSRLTFAASYFVWLAINLVVLGGLLRLTWGWLKAAPLPVRSGFLACALVTSVVWVVLQAQMELFVVAGLAGCYALLRAERPFLAGAVLSLALCKPHLAAAIVLLLLVKGQWRALGGLAAAGVPLLIGPVLLVGPRLFTGQARLLLSYSSTATTYDVNAGMMINIRGTVTSLTGSANVWLWLPLLVTIAAVALFVAVRIWVERPALHAQSWALAVMLPLLYSPHLHMQSLVLVVAAAGLYLIDSQASDRPVVDITFLAVAFVAVTAFWLLGLTAVSLMSLLVMAAFRFIAQRWPEPVAVTASEPQRRELALAS